MSVRGQSGGYRPPRKTKPWNDENGENDCKVVATALAKRSKCRQFNFVFSASPEAFKAAGF